MRRYAVDTLRERPSSRRVLVLIDLAVARGEAYHAISVQVKNRPERTVRTRPGYWVATR